jgi:hypothetical protein
VVTNNLWVRGGRCLIAAVAAFCSIAHADGNQECPDPQPVFSSAHVSATQLQALYTAVSSPKDAHCKPFQADSTQCVSDSVPEIWIFTKPGNPAHPAASRGQIFMNGVVTCIVRDGYFGGSEAAFRTWLASLREWDQTALARAKQQK